jgi:hypothetical protein
MAGEGEFVIKGPDTRVVFAEAAAYEPATRIGIDVPEHGLCRLPGEAAVRFCCRKLRGRFPVDYWIDHERLVNRSLIPETIAFDVWTGNHDRNMGNFVEDEAKDAQGGFRVKLYAIDFEKAAILRGEPDRFTLTTWPPTRFWPVEELGRLCRRFTIPHAACMRIGSLTRDQIAGILEQVRLDMDVPDIPWFDTAVDLLDGRARDIATLVQEAWHGN